MSKAMTIFCFVCSDDPVQQVFPVKVDKSTTVGELKQFIKEQKHSTLMASPNAWMSTKSYISDHLGK
jgi:hypothetical protein